MSETKHTAGPWDFVAETGERVMVYRAAPLEEQSIAEVTVQTYDGMHSNDAETLQNARLIAAAPELLTALNLLVTTAEFALADRGSEHLGDVTVETFTRRLAVARAAIAKATGG